MVEQLIDFICRKQLVLLTNVSCLKIKILRKKNSAKRFAEYFPEKVLKT